MMPQGEPDQGVDGPKSRSATAQWLAAVISAAWMLGVLWYFVLRALHYLQIISLPWVHGR